MPNRSVFQNGVRLPVKRVGAEDMVLLDSLSEQTIVQNLQMRYNSDLIYTNIGPVLVAVNPFKMIKGSYTGAVIRQYKGRNAFELPPHIFALADEAYRKMNSFNENQCVIITGESGSGKTESSKLIMQYISAVSGKSKDVQTVKDRMLASNPVLESFGNAKTVNNDNSSRFGKYMKVQFNSRGDPIGGHISNYLLEKSRVVQPGNGERSFHIFYQLCKAMPEADRQYYQIYTPDYYSYLYQSNCFDVPSIDDTKEYNETMEAMRKIGMSEDEIQETIRVVSAILWLGNIQFVEDNAEKSSLSEYETISLVASLLQVDCNALQSALCTRKLQTGVGQRAETFEKPLTAQQAAVSRDTLAKSLYSYLFDWLVVKINQSVHLSETKSDIVHIGVLDIYGFEIFKFNSFEQLCINFVNERLQQIFIQLTLKAEQEVYQQEGIPWQPIPFFNNKPCVELIENKPGILTILDDCCNTAKRDDMFVSELGNFFGASHEFLRCNARDFVIVHYAGQVKYDVEGFTTKNKDTLFDDLIEVIQGSGGLFASLHGWTKLEIQRGQKKKPPTVGKVFRGQVANLMNELEQCTPHYIRCIKPNQTKKPNSLEPKYTRNQVQYLGLQENITVRRAGYAMRMTYERFADRYWVASPSIRNAYRQRQPVDPYNASYGIVVDMGWQQDVHFALGATMMFLRQATSVFQLEERLEQILNEAAGIIQRSWGRYRNRRERLVLRAAAYDLVKGRKERRRGSINRDYRGDYLNLAFNTSIKRMLDQFPLEESVVFSSRSLTFVVQKQGLLAKLRKKKDLMQPRITMLTQEAIYLFEFFEKPETQSLGINVHARVPLQAFGRIVVSPFQDNALIFHFQGEFAKVDSLITTRYKTELLALLDKAYRAKSGGNPLALQFAPMDELTIHKEKGKVKVIKIEFSKDEAAVSEVVNSSKEILSIKIASGVPPHAVPEPYRPSDIDANMPVRPQLEALYDYAGNGTDELTFHVGDSLSLIRDDNDGWYFAELRGQKGYIPAAYVKVVATRPKANPKPVQQSATRGPGPVSATQNKFGGLTQNKVTAGFSGSNRPSPTGVMGAGRQVAQQKKSPWEAVLDPSSNEYYYYNSVTGQSTWDRPAGM